MISDLLHRVYAPIAYAYAASLLNSAGLLPVPHDPPIAHASGPAPDRILIIGGLAVRGLGVTSYELGLVGSLARALASRTGRGADVEAMGFGRFDTARAARELRSLDLGRFDAIIVQIGGWELMSLSPMDVWARDVTTVLAAVAESAPVGTPVLMLGTLPIAESGSLGRRIFRHQAQRMNVVQLAGCARARVATFVPLESESTTSTFGLGVDYSGWARVIAPVLVTQLAASAPHEAEYVDEAERQRALDDLHLTRDPDIRLERIVRMARVVFGTTAAALTIIDGDRQWVKTVIGDMDDSDLPRREAMCSRTVSAPGVSVVEDLTLDPTTASLPWVRGDDGKRFYAGFPLEAPGGQRIGALCILDAAPRTFTPDEVSLLRDLALRAQSVLWDPQPAPVPAAAPDPSASTTVEP